MKPELAAALFFLPERDIADIAPFGSGNVNDTYLINIVSGEQRLLQRLNPLVFPDPEPVIRNMRLVTDHLRKAAEQRPGGTTRLRPVTLYKGAAGDIFYDRKGNAWRMMSLIEGARTCETISTQQQAKELGQTLGLFHVLVNSLDSGSLADPLPGFHVTPGYLGGYDRVAEVSGTAPASQFCRRFIEARRSSANLLEDARETLTTGVIHGDPKVANFLFDNSCEKVISLIDLDTVKPGLLLHDLGDALRSCCNPAGEIPARPEHVVFDRHLFAGWLQGYFQETGLLLTDEDRIRIVDAVTVITFELGLRFYTDYLEGNRYFKVTRADLNLQRALTQFSLVQSIEQQREKLQSLANKITG